MNVEIRNDASQSQPVFDVVLDLDRYQFPRDATVRIEASRSIAVQRWSLGHVGNIVMPSDQERRLTEVSETALFKVLVVAGDGSGRLFGASQALKPTLPRESLIPLVPKDLGDEVWRVNLSADDQPELQVNSKLEMISETVRSDAQFRALVMPQVLRSVLRFIILEQREDPDDDGGGWWVGWLNLARSLLAEDIPSLGPREQGTDVDAASQWVDKVVAEFAAVKVEAREAYAQARMTS